MANKKVGTMRLPYAFTRRTDEELIALAKSGSDETTALASLGLKPYQVEKALKNKRWRKIWDKAYAELVVDKNKQIFASDDVRILSLLAQRTMPVNDLPDIVNIEVDCPQWFLEKIKNEKIVKVAQN